MNKKIYDIQYRWRREGPDGFWQNMGHPTRDFAKAERIARGSARNEPEHEFRVVEVTEENANS